MVRQAQVVEALRGRGDFFCAALIIRIAVFWGYIVGTSSLLENYHMYEYVGTLRGS